MTKVQGDFTNNAEAEQAKQTLMQAGIAEGHIRIWNIIPNRQPVGSGGNATITGAFVGGIYGGAGGAVAGAAIGTGLYGGDEEAPLPDPSGVRVVVDVEGDTGQVEALLQSARASDVHEGLG